MKVMIVPFFDVFSSGDYCDLFVLKFFVPVVTQSVDGYCQLVCPRWFRMQSSARTHLNSKEPKNKSLFYFQGSNYSFNGQEIRENYKSRSAKNKCWRTAAEHQIRDNCLKVVRWLIPTNLLGVDQFFDILIF